MMWLLAFSCTSDGEVRYDGHVVARIPVTDASDLAEVSAIGGDRWTETVIDHVDVRLTPAQQRRLTLDHEVLIPDVQALVDATRPAVPPLPGVFEDWRDLQEIEDHLADLDAGSEHATMVQIGTSVEGRAIQGLQILTPGADDRLGIVVLGAQHAREWVAASSALWIAEALAGGTDALLDRYKVLVVPVVNVDGYRHTFMVDRLWRKNRRDNGDGSVGVDLNRNWGVAWGTGGSSPLTLSDNYHGTGPFSEPEAASVRDFLDEHLVVGLFLDLHCTGQLVLHPFAATPVPTPDAALYEAGSLQATTDMNALYGTDYDDGAFNTRLYPASGAAIDFAYADHGANSWLFELRDRGQYGFLLPADQIAPTGEEALAGLRALVDAGRPRLDLFLPLPLVVGQRAEVQVRRAQAGSDVVIYRGLDGPGLTVLADGTELAMANAARFRTRTAADRGGAEVVFRVPEPWSGRTVRFQAVSGAQGSLLAEAAVP